MPGGRHGCRQRPRCPPRRLGQWVHSGRAGNVAAPLCVRSLPASHTRARTHTPPPHGPSASAPPTWLECRGCWQDLELQDVAFWGAQHVDDAACELADNDSVKLRDDVARDEAFPKKKQKRAKAGHHFCFNSSEAGERASKGHRAADCSCVHRRHGLVAWRRARCARPACPAREPAGTKLAAEGARKG